MKKKKIFFCGLNYYATKRRIEAAACTTLSVFALKILRETLTMASSVKENK